MERYVRVSETIKLGELAKEVNADVVLATDPDADRLGIYALDTKSGEYIPFTGNMSGMLIAEYLMREKTKTNTMPANPALVKTIVTTNMSDVMTAKYDVKQIEVLTGFKFIGEQIKLFEQSGSNNYVFGLEESYGCLAGTHARDKDAIVAVMMLCEAAAYYKKQGLTLWDQMLNIYEKYGYFFNQLDNYAFEGAAGMQKMTNMMDSLRNEPPKEICGSKVIWVGDYKTGVTTDGETGLPKSNVLQFYTEDGSVVSVRPSGTEPKLKIYYSLKAKDEETANAKLEEIQTDVAALLERAKK